MSEFIACAHDKRDRHWTVYAETSGVEFRDGEFIGSYIAPIYATVELRNGETVDVPGDRIENYLDLSALNWRRPRRVRVNQNRGARR